MLYRAWSNQASMLSAEGKREEAMAIVKEMSDYAREHDSKFGLYTATFTNAQIESGLRMEHQAEKLLLECISYKEKYLPNLNIAPVYLSLAKIYHNWSKKDKVMEVTEKALQEPDLRPEQIVQVWSYRCLAAYVDDEKTEEFNHYYAELEKVRKETGISTNLSQRADIYHAEINGDYEKMLALAQNMASPLDRMSTTARAYKMLGRWEDAYYLQVDYKNYSDSINSAELRNLTLNHSLALDAARAENEAKELKLENQQLQLELLYMLAIIAILVIASLAFILYRRNKYAKEIETAYNKLEDAYNQLEETTTAKERIESELRIARDIQMSMVPQTFPERSDLDLYALMTPAKEVGGDLYDFLIIDDQLYFCLGDVSGKGVPASLFMAQAIRLFRALAKQQRKPSDIATCLNNELTENNDNGMFVTMFIGVTDLTTGHLSFCNAGHNPPLLDGEFIDMEANAPLGLWSGLDYEGEEIDNIRNKQLFIYTDGLNEAEDTAQEQFGDERLQQMLRQMKTPTAKQVIDTFRQTVESHRKGAVPNDDLTMLAIRCQ